MFEYCEPRYPIFTRYPHMGCYKVHMYASVSNITYGVLSTQEVQCMQGVSHMRCSSIQGALGVWLGALEVKRTRRREL